MCQWLHVEGDAVQNCLECGAQAAVGLANFCGLKEIGMSPLDVHERTQALYPSRLEFRQAEYERLSAAADKRFNDALQWLSSQDSEHARVIEELLDLDD